MKIFNILNIYKCNSIKRNKITFNTPRRYKCYICFQYFRLASSIRKHMKDIHFINVSRVKDKNKYKGDVNKGSLVNTFLEKKNGSS